MGRKGDAGGGVVVEAVRGGCGGFFCVLSAYRRVGAKLPRKRFWTGTTRA